MQKADEGQHVFSTLEFTVGVILQSDADDRGRIAAAYREAQTWSRALLSTQSNPMLTLVDALPIGLRAHH